MSVVHDELESRACADDRSQAFSRGFPCTLGATRVVIPILLMFIGQMSASRIQRDAMREGTSRGRIGHRNRDGSRHLNRCNFERPVTSLPNRRQHALRAELSELASVEGSVPLSQTKDRERERKRAWRHNYPE